MKKKIPGISIRPFKIQDYEAVLSLWQRVGLPVKPRGRDTRERISREISGSDPAVFLVAESDNRIVGSVLGTHDGRKGWINRLAVHPDYQRLGIATKLVDAVEKELNNRGIEIIACLIEEPNQGSREFFRKIGYIKHPDIFYFSKRKHPAT